MTDRIIELDARLRNAEAEEQRLLEMFKEAQNVTEMLQVEKGQQEKRHHRLFQAS